VDLNVRIHADGCVRVRRRRRSGSWQSTPRSPRRWRSLVGECNRAPSGRSHQSVTIAVSPSDRATRGSGRAKAIVRTAAAGRSDLGRKQSRARDHGGDSLRGKRARGSAGSGGYVWAEGGSQPLIAIPTRRSRAYADRGHRRAASHGCCSSRVSVCSRSRVASALSLRPACPGPADRRPSKRTSTSTATAASPGSAAFSPPPARSLPLLLTSSSVLKTAASRSKRH
jgi:hypothetical protein